MTGRCRSPHDRYHHHHHPRHSFVPYAQAAVPALCARKHLFEGLRLALYLAFFFFLFLLLYLFRSAITNAFSSFLHDGHHHDHFPSGDCCLFSDKSCSGWKQRWWWWPRKKEKKIPISAASSSSSVSFSGLLSFFLFCSLLLFLCCPFFCAILSLLVCVCVQSLSLREA